MKTAEELDQEWFLIADPSYDMGRWVHVDVLLTAQLPRGKFRTQTTAAIAVVEPNIRKLLKTIEPTEDLAQAREDLWNNIHDREVLALREKYGAGAKLRLIDLARETRMSIAAYELIQKEGWKERAVSVGTEYSHGKMKCVVPH